LPDINLPINLNIERAEVGENSQWAGSFIVSFEHNYCAVPKRERDELFPPHYTYLCRFREEYPNSCVSNKRYMNIFKKPLQLSTKQCTVSKKKCNKRQLENHQLESRVR